MLTSGISYRLIRLLISKRPNSTVILVVISTILIVLSISGCGPLRPPTETPTATATEAQVAAPTTEAPTDHPTYTATVAFIATIVVDEVDVHAGPGIEYPLITTIDEPISVRVIGVNEGKTWLFILLPDNQQGWIPIEAAAYEFDLNLLPVVKETPLAPTPYGAKMLVPPQLLGVSPGSPSNPARGVLSALAISGLAVLVISASGVFTARKRCRRPAIARLLHTLISLF
jgi:hypothetical protein